MGALELKSNIHSIVDAIDNEPLLQMLFEFLTLRKNNTNSTFWNGLTSEQMHEIMIAFEESENEENLIDKETFLRSL